MINTTPRLLKDKETSEEQPYSPPLLIPLDCTDIEGGTGKSSDGFGGSHFS